MNPMLCQYDVAALDLYSRNLDNSVQHCNQYTSLAVSLSQHGILDAIGI